MDDNTKAEIYAEREQHDWTQGILTSYRAYPEQVQALTDWIEHYGGVSLPLRALVGDPRATVGNNMVSAESIFFNVPGALAHLAQAVYEGKELNQTRLVWARNLHYGERYEPALQAIERVLAEHPRHLEALTLKADIYEHQEKYVEARELIERVPAEDPDFKDALWLMMLICEHAEEWERLLDVCDRYLRRSGLKCGDVAWTLLLRAKAFWNCGITPGWRRI